MTKHPLGCVLTYSVVASLGLVSFAACLVAEGKRSKKGDLMSDGKFCFLPTRSHVFELGVAATVCLSAAQIIGNVLLCADHRWRPNTRKPKKPALTAILLAFSWMSFGAATILISAATSMSRTQAYGEGWLDGECYLVRDGVYATSGVLSLLAVLALLGAASIKITTNQQVDQDHKINARK
ncbi:Long-chain fatty alcohol dehydrogenase family protein [Hibiscus syriacus]|uniref:Long-chain fatty alcohol dehydrogenase family protein n=1 Tax=Hibiscus syriacus TaxID=106335 RepID=A0A6A3AFD0_HIBSY|nr:protein MODIFYING WALL LIGNIN-2-like [Hibiscus syriacus]KAE8702826.1 Long-chain fatty alcohol dehydrogenase family protein [Hibiscus syriacus]